MPRDQEPPPTPVLRRGRPPSQHSQRAALKAAVELLDERGVSGFSIEEVARRARVSKATIYKHWSGRLDLAVSAYGEHVTTAVPVLRSGDVVADLLDQVCRLADLYRGPRGLVIAQLLAAGVNQESESLRARFFGPRRPDTVALVREGVDSGVLRNVLDLDLVVDLLFGPIVFRLFNGMEALTAAQASEIAAVALTALSAPGAPAHTEVTTPADPRGCSDHVNDTEPR